MAEPVINLKNLEVLRKINNLSVEDLMNQVGYDRTTYYSWQKKGAIPSSEVVKLHSFFNVSTDILLDVIPLTITNAV